MWVGGSWIRYSWPHNTLKTQFFLPRPLNTWTSCAGSLPSLSKVVLDSTVRDAASANQESSFSLCRFNIIGHCPRSHFIRFLSISNWLEVLKHTHIESSHWPGNRISLIAYWATSVGAQISFFWSIWWTWNRRITDKFRAQVGKEDNYTGDLSVHCRDQWNSISSSFLISLKSGFL